ncbi:MAG: GatB/YqeY domain-containing protein [bacterium]
MRSQIQEDMKNAMRAKAVSELGTIRLLLAAIKQREIDERITLDDAQILAVIDKMVKQRGESIKQYQQGNRQDLVDKEAAEIEILKKYLPKALTEDEITALIKTALVETNVTLIKDMAKVMAYIKPKAQGKADMGKISLIVKSMLK